MVRRLYSFLVAVVVASWLLSAHAAPAVEKFYVSGQRGTTDFLDTRQAACDAYAAMWAAFNPVANTGVVSQNGGGYYCSVYPSNLYAPYEAQNIRVYETCPSGANPVDGQCPEPTCQAGETRELTFFDGWNSSATSGSAVTTVPPILEYCDGSCHFANTATVSCDVDEDPSPNGYYRATCTSQFTGSGQACSQQTPDPDDSDPQGGGDTGNGDGGDGGDGGDPGDGGDGGDPGDGGDGGDPGDGGGGGCTPEQQAAGQCTGDGGNGNGSSGGGTCTAEQQAAGQCTGQCGGEGQPACSTGGGGGGTTTPTEPTCVEGTAGCSPLGSAGSPAQIENLDLGTGSVTPVSGFGNAAAACPPPTVIQTSFGSLTWEWNGFCQFLVGIRPIVIALAWLSAGLGLLAFVRGN